MVHHHLLIRDCLSARPANDLFSGECQVYNSARGSHHAHSADALPCARLVHSEQPFSNLSRSLHRHALCQVTGFVHIRAPRARGVVRQ